MEKDWTGRIMTNIFFITGAESTGKSTLTDMLANHYSGAGVPEFARQYLEALGHMYTYADLEKIARGQLSLIRKHRDQGIVFFDSCLIIIKVWFREVYGRMPDWLDEEIRQWGQGVYLLCEPDLPWEYDPLRENPHRREYLSGEYVRELETAGFAYFRIFGTGDQRLQNAIEIVDKRIYAG
jgi:nicotinamide riboside kinase